VLEPELPDDEEFGVELVFEDGVAGEGVDEEDPPSEPAEEFDEAAGFLPSDLLSLR
jgi:hypothetical protein